jgi:hypothetical protein
MSALLLDVLIYGASTAIGLGALTMVGRYYGRTPPPPKPPEPPKDEQ